MRRSTDHLLVPTVAAFLLGVAVTGSVARGQAPAAPAAPATTRSAAEQEADEALVLRKAWVEQLKHLPAARVSSVRDVVRFTIENDDVVVRTSVPPTELAAVVVDGQPMLATIATHRGDAAGAGQGAAGQGGAGREGTYQPPVFSLIHHHYPPAGGIAITQVNVIAPRVQISNSAEGAGAFRNVDFIQSDEFLEDGDERVRLYVQEHRDDEPIVELKLVAMNVAELRRKYPAETMRYLDPIFREFGQSGVLFQVSPQAAWQVLGVTHTPPADVVKQVDDVLVKLDADDAKQREAGAKALEQLGQPAALVLMRRDRATMSEEQQARVETFLAPYKPLSDEEAARMGGDTEFLLSALSSEDGELASRALDRLKEVAQQPIAFDLKTTGAARADAITKLRARLLPATTQPATAKSTARPATNALPLEPRPLPQLGVD